MIFDVDRRTLLEVFPAERIVRAAPDAVADVVEREEDLRFLCDVGLPQGLFQTAPPIAGDGEVQKSRLLDLGAEGDEAEVGELEDVGTVLLIGGVQYWYLFLRPSDGMIYSFADGGDGYHPVNRDLSSLCRMLYLIEREQPRIRRIPGVPFTSPPHEAYRRAYDAVRAEIEPADPIAYSRTSLWPAYFAHFLDGRYPAYDDGPRL